MTPGYVWLCFQSSDPIAPDWEKGLNSWPRGHELYDIESPIENKDSDRDGLPFIFDDLMVSLQFKTDSCRSSLIYLRYVV